MKRNLLAMILTALLCAVSLWRQVRKTRPKDLKTP